MSRRYQGGFAYIAAIVLLVVMAALAASMLRLNSVSQSTANQDLLAIRAGQAARAGIEWGLFQLRSGSCNGAQRNLSDFHAQTGFIVSVVCRRAGPYNEGEIVPEGASAPVPLVKFIYRIEATACNAGSSCPNNDQVGNDDYVERRRVVTACLTAANADCY